MHLPRLFSGAMFAGIAITASTVTDKCPPALHTDAAMCPALEDILNTNTFAAPATYIAESITVYSVIPCEGQDVLDWQFTIGPSTFGYEYTDVATDDSDHHSSTTYIYSLSCPVNTANPTGTCVDRFVTLGDITSYSHATRTYTELWPIWFHVIKTETVSPPDSKSISTTTNTIAMTPPPTNLPSGTKPTQQKSLTYSGGAAGSTWRSNMSAMAAGVVGLLLGVMYL